MDKALRLAYKRFILEPSKLTYKNYVSFAIRGDRPYRCFYCPNLENLEDMYICECGAHSCSDCALNFVCGEAYCGATGCQDCLDKCPLCNSNICPGEHNTTCSSCDRTFCLDCTRYCEECDEIFCLSHMSHSDYCIACYNW